MTTYSERMQTKHCRILLADDDPVGQHAVGRVVAKRGHELVSVATGAEDYLEKSDATRLMSKIERVLLRLTEAAA